jgi:transposase
MGRHYGKYIIGQVLEMKEQGITHKAIGEKYGLTKIQIKKLVESYNRKSRNPIAVPKRRGRPRKNPITNQREMEVEIKRLKMEVDLLRSFLQAAGRR